MMMKNTVAEQQRKQKEQAENYKGIHSGLQKDWKVLFTYLRTMNRLTNSKSNTNVSHKSKKCFHEEDESSRWQEDDNDDLTNFCSRSKTFREQKEENSIT